MIKVMAGVILSLFLLGDTQAQTPGRQLFHAGFQGGIALPKVSYALYRPPIGITGGVYAMMRPHKKWGLQFSVNALHTFSLGTAAQVDQDLEFNTLWAAVEACVHLQGFWTKENFLVIGVGSYKHHQILDNKENDLTTQGLSLGLMNWQRKKRFSTRISFRWHLLFEPSEKPQILTVTLGLMI